MTSRVPFWDQQPIHVCAHVERAIFLVVQTTCIPVATIFRDKTYSGHTAASLTFPR